LEVFLSGKTERVSRALEHVMKTAARAQEFEKANAFKRQLFALRHIQDVALIKNPPPTPSFSKGGGEGGGFRKFRIESYDLSHFGGKGIVGAMAVVENGRAQQSEYRLFHIRSTKTQNEVAGLQEILTRRLTHREWPLPHLIVVDGNAVQKRAAEIVLARHAFAIPVVAVVKDERHRPREIIGGVRYGSAEERAIVLANSEAHRFVLRFQKKQGYNKM
jgi:excinuclease UvrABC nuclease subunit